MDSKHQAMPMLVPVNIKYDSDTLSVSMLESVSIKKDSGKLSHAHACNGKYQIRQWYIKPCSCLYQEISNKTVKHQAMPMLVPGNIKYDSDTLSVSMLESVSIKKDSGKLSHAHACTRKYQIRQWYIKPCSCLYQSISNKTVIH